jgi:putative tricarboxylic transport membrane protein
MSEFLGIAAYMVDVRFVLLVFAGSVAGLFVGAIPGLSVSMATALLVSITYSWHTTDAIATVMGVYVVGVFSGALSAILINIPGAPSSVVTTLDGFPLANRGEAYKALKYAIIYSFIGTLFGFIVLWLLAKPISMVALKFTPMDYFQLALFGFAEVLSVISGSSMDAEVSKVTKAVIRTKDVLKHFLHSLYYSTIGTVVGALPGAGGPVAAFLAYSEAKRIVKHPSRPFGEGAVEGIVASEAANNACIGGALIPLLTLAIPGDAVTAIILSVFYVHGLRPGPMVIRTNP